MMQSILAGWVAGYGVAIVFTLVGTMFVMASRRPAEGQVFANPLAVGVALSIGGFLLWTLVGLVLGAFYPAIADATGVPSWPFTGGVVAVTALVTIGASILAGRVWWHIVALGALVAVAFGVVLPVLAGRDEGV